MLTQLQYNQETQRRPSRISVASMCEDQSSLATSGESQTSRMLKCSTITRVPPAKSRLKQPVAGLASSPSSATGKDKQQKPSRLARPNNRPTSLSLRGVTPAPRTSQRLISCPSKQIPSISTLPQLTRPPETSSRGQQPSSGRECSLRGANLPARTQSTVKSSKSYLKTKKTSAPSIYPNEVRSVALKNMAVVYPQHSLRVKSSATTTMVNKLSPTTSKLLSNPTTNHLAADKVETGNVSSHNNHKDVASRLLDATELDKRRTATSKQDASRISGRHQQINMNDHSGTSLIPSSSLSVAAENEKTNDEHFEKSNNANHLPSSSQVNRATSEFEMADNSQHGNIKQSNKHIPANKLHPIAMTRTLNQKPNINRANNNNNSNCSVHDCASKPTATKSASIYLKHDSNFARTINDRILPKPLGQQVLSLMMLDVGLMPSNNHLQHQHHQQNQRASCSDEAHVCIQGPDLSYHTHDDGRMSSVQRLQVRLSTENNESSRSISLPSSPRMRIRERDFAPINSLANQHLKPADQELLLRSTCNSQDSHSLSSSSSSSLNYYPPLLALSNQLNGFKFDELVRANPNRSDCFKPSDSSENSSTKTSKRDTIPANDQFTQVTTKKSLTNDPDDYKLESRLGKTNRLEECARHIGRMINPEQVCKDLPSSQLERGGVDHAQSSERWFADESDPQSRRSHSISGQEYHFTQGYQRLKQTNAYNRPGAFENYSQFNTQTPNRISQASPSPYQQHYQPLAGRSPSPLNVNIQAQYGSPLRDATIKYNQDNLQQRKQLHSSLECLNTGYSDYQLQLQQYHNQNHHQSHLQNHHQLPNQHYAASYVLAQPPANTIINQNGDQDLAAAAMESPSSKYHFSLANSSINNNLISRAISQVSQAASRRAGYHNGAHAGVGANSHHPIRAGHSSLSLASSSYMIEDKLQNEIKKLVSELKSEKEKNEALNSQLNINSNLMAAFEQSLTTLNTRLRQLTTLNEKKDNEIGELRAQLSSLKAKPGDNEKSTLEMEENNNGELGKSSIVSESDRNSENNLLKIIEDLRKQLIEKDRLLTDTRLEALSAAHQLEQLESKLNGEQSMLPNEDDLDEGVMVVNHSPSDSDAITDPTHFNDITSQIRRSNQISNDDNKSFTLNSNGNKTGESNENNNIDNQSNHSSDYSTGLRHNNQDSLGKSISQQFNEDESTFNELASLYKLTIPQIEQ